VMSGVCGGGGSSGVHLSPNCISFGSDIISDRSARDISDVPFGPNAFRAARRCLPQGARLPRRAALPALSYFGSWPYPSSPPQRPRRYVGARSRIGLGLGDLGRQRVDRLAHVVERLELEGVDLVHRGVDVVEGGLELLEVDGRGSRLLVDRVDCWRSSTEVLSIRFEVVVLSAVIWSRTSFWSTAPGPR
jgi:hypothetical protein